MNLFEAGKQNVTTRQAAELYGIRVGRNRMAVCPFHNDKNPSMKVDKRFHCFAYQADGDAVDFVSRLFGLKKIGMLVGEKIKLTSFDDLMGISEGESSIEIEISRIVEFQNHPFKVKDDEKMEELVESIRMQGILTPVLVRPDDKDGYEMISGHRRMHAAKRLGLETIPAIVKEMTDDESTIAMVNANIQREELLPSEKAFAYKMKMDALKKAGKQPTSDQKGPRLAAWSIGEEMGMSGTQVKRYIRLTELIPALLDMVDEKRLGFTIGEA